MEEKTVLFEVVEELALRTIMLEYDDMVALGSVLEKLEEVERGAVHIGHKEIRSLVVTLRQVVEKIILKELPDLQEGLHLLRNGVALLQNKISHSGVVPPSKEEQSFWERTKVLTGEIRSISFNHGCKEGDSEGPKAESFSITQDLGLYHDFISEALEHLGTIEMKIINLEQSPGDKECINAIFRPFHTIKGVSGFLNLTDINRFCHAMESLLDRARNGQLPVNQETIDLILEAIDLLRNMIIDLKMRVDQGQTTLSRFDLEPYLEKIDRLQSKDAATQVVTRLKGDKEEAVGPPLGEILSGRGIVSKSDVSDALRIQADSQTGLRLGEILVKECKAKPKEIIEALRDQRRIASQADEITVKVDADKLDTLVDLVGELVITQSLVQQNPVFSSIQDQKLSRDFSQMKRITADLQRNSMSLRMVPIRQSFQKMIRFVRDLAKKSGKLVDLHMQGEETEIDRNMVDSLYDPLVHMIRNAIDHGIESPSERTEIGKAETGQIFLRAYQKGGNVVIEIEDDGRGLNRTKILQKARDRGLVSSDEQLSDSQIDNLIFEPGFSTADQITDLSGRGVGMDVVTGAMMRLKGKAEIFSAAGKGCRFVLRVPLTLAILDGIVVRIGPERYVIPSVFIKETLRPQPNDLATVQKRGELIRVRDTFFPLVRLHQLLNVSPQKKEPWEALVVVVEDDAQQKGLMVDDLVGKQEVVIKNLGERLKDVRGVAGATIMGDGRVGLILDVHGIFEMDENLPSPFSSPPSLSTGMDRVVGMHHL